MPALQLTLKNLCQTGKSGSFERDGKCWPGRAFSSERILREIPYSKAYRILYTFKRRKILET